MDLNYDAGLYTDTYGNLNPVLPSLDGSGSSLWIGNYPSVQLCQLNAQMDTLNLTNTRTNYLEALLALSQGDVGYPQSFPQQSPFMVTSVQPILYNYPIVLPSLITNSFGYPLTMSQDQVNAGGAIPPASLPLQASFTQSSIASETPFSNQVPIDITTRELPPTLIGSYGATSPTPYVSQQSTEDTPKNHTVLESMSHPRQHAPLETLHVSTPHLKSPVKPNKGLPKILVSPKRLLDGSSVTSLSSNPVSPVSIEYSIVFSDSGSSGTSSPKSPRFPIVNGYLGKGPMSPTEAKSLINACKFPQDQCFRCNKKVYPMEKEGPVKGVVYHKGCFQCVVCQTRLNLKNFFHNQHDMGDLHVYCKSHQPEATGKGASFDSNAVQIKGAMNVPKLGKINEQIRGDTKGNNMDINSFEIKSALIAPKRSLISSNHIKTSGHVYNIGLDSMEISHATHVPAADLQAGNKLKKQSWGKEGRQHESVPPPDVVRSNEPGVDYDLAEIDRIPVEFYPEYDYDELTDTYIFRKEDNL